MKTRKRKKRKYYPHIYFESKVPKTRDSVTKAVKDIGKPKVSSAKEVGALAVAQLIDWLDGYTYNHYRERIKFSGKIWAGRMLILNRLANKYGGKKYIAFIKKIKYLVSNKKLDKKTAKQIVLNYANKHNLPLLKSKI